MNWRSRIERTPAVLGGEPVVRGTRVPVRVLVGGLAGGMTPEQVSASYRVTLEDVRAALQYAAELLAEERVLGAMPRG
ncbi:MAG: DUF433 domain-containing protein [Deltaproteobacteria bacterium]|nr:DUF433 domain-containing protein [Deltaproteobacteria bacterium]